MLANGALLLLHRTEAFMSLVLLGTVLQHLNTWWLFILLNLVSLFQSYRFPSLKLRPASSLLSPIPIKQSKSQISQLVLALFRGFPRVLLVSTHLGRSKCCVHTKNLYDEIRFQFFFYLQLYQRFVVHLRRDVPSNIIEKKLKLLYFLNIILKVQRNRVVLFSFPLY